IVGSKTRIGGEKNPDLERIRGLDPDLVIANIEENLREHVATLRSWSIPVWVTYPRTVAEGIQLIAELGAVTGTEARASELIEEIEPLYARVLGVAVRRLRLVLERQQPVEPRCRGDHEQSGDRHAGDEADDRQEHERDQHHAKIEEERHGLTLPRGPSRSRREC